MPWGYFVIGGILLAAAGYLGFRVLLHQYLHSEALLAKVNAATSSALHVDGAFEPLEWQDSVASSGSFRGRGDGSGSVEHLEARGIKANLNLRSIWDGHWDITEITVEEGSLRLAETANADRYANADKDADTDTGKRTNDAVPTNSAGEESSGFFASLLPQKTRIGKIKILSGNLEFPLPGSDVPSAIRRVRITARPLGDSFDDGYHVTGYGGVLHLPDRKKLSLLDFDMRIRDQKIFIADAVADLDDTIGARVRCNGEIHPANGHADLEIKLTGIDVQDIIAPDWKQKLTGRVSADLDWNVANGVSTREGTVELVDGVLQALPVLDNLADYTKHDTFRRLTLNKVSGDLTETAAGIRIDNIVVESAGTLRVLGSLVKRGDHVQGEFQVGVVPGVLRWIPGAEQKVFTRQHDSHLWTEMQVHGPLHDLQENLSRRLLEGAIAQTIEETPERVIEGGTEVLRQGTDLLKEGVNTGIDLIDGFVPLLGP